MGNHTYRKTGLLKTARTADEDKVTIRKDYPNSGWSEHVHAKKRTSWKEDTTVELMIDEAALMHYLGGKATRSKSGRARLLNGTIWAVVRKRVVGDKTTVEVPLPDGYYEVTKG